MVLFDWGATEDEMLRRLPGDDLIPHPRIETTRATTIRATPAEIWPWLLQIGQDRGGFYSYDWIENLFGSDIHSANELLPELQELALGDTIRLHPGEHSPVFTVHALDPPHFLVLSSTKSGEDGPHANASWSFVLDPVDDENTRLIARSRLDFEGPLAVIGWHLLQPVSMFMERKMLLGIKHRAQDAEKDHRGRSEQAGQG